jgi:hypothetical protein
MLSWFKQEEESEPELKFRFLKNCIYTNEYVKFYQTEARDFVPEVYNSKIQRKVDPEHVNNLSKALKISKHCVGTFKIVQYEDEYRLIDGQHRVLALNKNMEEDSKFNLDLILEVYTVNDENELREWFKRANTVKNFEEDFASINVIQIVDELIQLLKADFKDCIVTSKITERTNIIRPKIDEQDLNNVLTKYITDNEIREVKKIYDEIIKQNKLIGLYNSKKQKELKISENMWYRAKTNGFYLGLYKNCKWIDSLDKNNL